MPVHRYEDALFALTQQVRWIESQDGTNYTNWFQASINAQHHPDERMPEGALWLIQKMMLEQADPVYVSDNVTEMLDYARAEFKPEPVLRTDPFTQVGFAILPRPILMDDSPENANGEGKIPVRAIGWVPLFDPDNADHGCFWIVLYTHRDDEHLLASSQQVDWSRMSPNSTLTAVHMFQWSYGETPWDQLNGEFQKRGLEQSALIQTFWRLGSQVMRSKQRLPRPARKDAKRLGLEKEDVTVITLRREGDTIYDQEGEAPDWKHKWLVRGHWRNQWYPSLNEHRQIWVNPYVKGPEHLPLKLTKRVIEFTR